MKDFDLRSRFTNRSMGKTLNAEKKFARERDLQNEKTRKFAAAVKTQESANV